VDDGIELEDESTRANRCQVRASGSTLTVVGGCVLAFVMVCPLAGLGQEPRLEPPVRSAPEAGPQTEMDQPAEEPEVVSVKRGLFQRLGPQSLTEEQREEAERLKKLAAKYGTDPTALVGRLQLTSAYFNLPQGAQAVDTIARVDVPFRKDFLLRVDAPFLKWSDPDRPGATSRQGFSDLAVTAGWRAYNTPEYAVLLGVVSTMPTAAETGLGLGKYTVGPTIATARFLPRWDSLLLGLFTQQVSVGGDPARNSVNFSKFTAQINSFWAERWWSIFQTVWQIDWERNAKGSLTLELEVGRSVVGRWGVFVRPGIGVFGRDLLGAYDWNVEAGVRYMFPSF
jgi:hypothetical protein